MVTRTSRAETLQIQVAPQEEPLYQKALGLFAQLPAAVQKSALKHMEGYNDCLPKDVLFFVMATRAEAEMNPTIVPEQILRNLRQLETALRRR